MVIYVALYNYIAQCLRYNVLSISWVLLQKGCQKPNAICIMVLVSSSYAWWPLYPLFSCYITLIGLSNVLNVVIIFVINLLIHTSIVKHPKQNKWSKNSEPIVGVGCSTSPSTKTLLHDSFGLWGSFPDYSAKNLLNLLVKPKNSCWTPIDSNNHAYLVGQRFASSALFKPKTFSYCIIVLE